jgi:hypothetical protein
MNRPDLELPDGWKEASKESWDDFCVCEWELKPEHEYAYKVGWFYGAIWRQNIGTGLMNPGGHNEPCYYCSKPCNSLSGNPSQWPIPLCHKGEPGVVKWHHTSCVMKRIINDVPDNKLVVTNTVTVTSEELEAQRKDGLLHDTDICKCGDPNCVGEDTHRHYSS